MTSLSSFPAVQTLAADLKLKRTTDPENAIRQFCLKRLRELVRQSGITVRTLPDLLSIVAEKLGTNFVEIRTDEDLVRIKAEYVKRREVAVALLEETLSSEVFAMTFALSAPREGERPFVSIIDCRGGKAPRAYFSKWHEIAHLLT